VLKELAEYIVKQIVSNPDLVYVTTVKRGDVNVLAINIDKKDRGRLIGREGQTIKALQSLVNVIIPEEKKIVIEVVE
jgi:uncharacterized protein